MNYRRPESEKAKLLREEYTKLAKMYALAERAEMSKEIAFRRTEFLVDYVTSNRTYPLPNSAPYTPTVSETSNAPYEREAAEPIQDSPRKVTWR